MSASRTPAAGIEVARQVLARNAAILEPVPRRLLMGLICSGTNEIQCRVIAQRGLGLFRCGASLV